MPTAYFCCWCLAERDYGGVPTGANCPHCSDDVTQPCPACQCPGCTLSRQYLGTVRADTGTPDQVPSEVFYFGIRTEGGVSVYRLKTDAYSDELPLRLDLRNHSPTGFEWGYGGSGPAQLALALLADAVGDAAALAYYQHYKEDEVADFSKDRWHKTSEGIRQWVADYEHAGD